MANKMLIDATHPEETRVVVLRGNRVEEFDFETAQRKQLRGNIYLAKVTRVEPSLQAAFVDYGGNRHGFLAFSEIHPDYYQIPVADRQALIDEDSRARARLDDDDDEKRSNGGGGGGRRRGRSRHRESRRHERPDEAVRSDVLATDEAAGNPAGDAPTDFAAGEGAPVSAHEFEAPSQAYPEPVEPAAAAIGETANPPVPAEIGAADPITRRTRHRLRSRRGRPSPVLPRPASPVGTAYEGEHADTPDDSQGNGAFSAQEHGEHGEHGPTTLTKTAKTTRKRTDDDERTTTKRKRSSTPSAAPTPWKR